MGHHVYASKRLLAALAESGHRPAALAATVHVCVDYIRRIRRGHPLPHNNGTNTVVAALAEFVGVPPEESLSPDPPFVRGTSGRRGRLSRRVAPPRAVDPLQHRGPDPEDSDLPDAEIERRYQVALAQIRRRRNSDEQGS